MAAEAATLFRCQLCRRSAFAGRRSHLYSAGHQRRLRAALARLAEKVRGGGAGGGAAAGGAALPGRRARAARLVPLLRARGPEPPEPRRADGAARRPLGTPGQPGARESRGRLLEEEQGRPQAEGRLPAVRGRVPALSGVSLPSPGCLRREGRRSHSAGCGSHPRHGTEETRDGTGHLRGLCAQVQSGHDSPFAMEEQEQPGSSWNSTFLREEPICASSTMPQLRYPETGQPLTFIGHQETGGEGNIHTGAKPPWLMNEEEEGERQIGPSYEEFLKEKQKQKLKQLPPNRVGANFDHSSQTGDGWLPSFGRVWNHGRRWQSRHQFKAESGNKQPGSKRKRP